MKTKAMFPGSFDPIHNGHLEILIKSLSMFDNVVLYVANNDDKGHFRSIEERVRLAKKVIDFHELADRVEVRGAKEGELSASVAKELGISNIVRGIRGETINDFEEYLMKRYLEINKDLTFTHIPTNLKVSSTKINENKGNLEVLELLVSESIVDEL